MSGFEAHNPYAAPAIYGSPAVVGVTRPVNWLLWIFGAVVFESGLTAACLYNRIDGQTCAIVSGFGLTIAVILAARLYLRRMALLLAQCLNLCVWGSMLVTAWLILPILNRSGLSGNDVEIFGMIWCGGAIVVTLLALVFGTRVPSNDVQPTPSKSVARVRRMKADDRVKPTAASFRSSGMKD